MINFVLFGAALFIPLSAGVITFGDCNSAIKIADGAVLKIGTRMDVIGGSVVKEAGGIIEGDSEDSKIVFEDAWYTTTGHSISMNGEFKPSGCQAIELTGGSNLSVAAGTHVEACSVSGIDNRLQGQPVFDGAVELLDATTTLSVAVQSKFNQDIDLGGGTIYLEGDLKFAQGKQFAGEGSVYVNGYDVVLSGSDLFITGTTDWYDAKALFIWDRTELSGTWNFNSNATLLGFGNVLDISPGGTLNIKSGATVDFVNVSIRGLGTGTIQFQSDTSLLRLSNCTIELNDDYNFTNGQIYVDAPLAFVVEDHTLTFEQTASFSIDNVTVVYDDISQGGTVDPLLHDGVHLSLLNNGRLEKSKHDLVKANSHAIVAHSGHLINLDDRVKANSDAIVAHSGHLINLEGRMGENEASLATLDHGPAHIYFSTNTTMTYDINLSSGHQMYLEDSLVLDGDGYSINCDRSSGAIITLDVDVSATLENVLLDGLRPSHIQMEPGSHLSFGDGTLVRLAEDVDLGVTWTFAGNSELMGSGTRLTLGTDGVLYAINDGIFTVQDLSIFGVQDNRVRCQSDYAEMIFKDVALIMSSDFSFTTGSYSIDGNLAISGLHTFEYESAMGSTIDSNSLLFIDRGTTFYYNPLAAYRNLLVMTDNTSYLQLGGCTLDISSTGLQLTKGTVVVSNKNYVQSAATHREEAFILGDGNVANDVEVEIDAGGDLDLSSGILVYKNTLG